MNKIKQIAVIECGDSSKLFQLSPVSQSQGYVVSKIYYQNEVPANLLNANHPGAEIVSDKQAIIDDSLIDMVIVSSPSPSEMDIVGEMLKANKATTIL